jgi:hypothetical protein
MISFGRFIFFNEISLLAAIIILFFLFRVRPSFYVFFWKPPFLFRNAVLAS